MSSPRVSVVVCTLDRLEELQGALDSVARQKLPRADFEVVVVDNGSSDGTWEWLGGKAEVHALREPVPGLSWARNAGWRAAKAPIVAFLDDDARAEPDWLERVLEVFEALAPAAKMAGGRVEPEWGAPPPPWLDQDFRHFLSLVDWGGEPRFLGPGEWIAGANMAFRREFLQEAGGFPERLGRVGGKLLSGEETHLARLLLARGEKVYYHPAMSVRHRIPAARLTEEWMIRRTHWQGYTEAAQNIVGGRVPWPKRAKAAFKQTGRLAGALWRLASSVRGEDNFRRRCEAVRTLGRLRALLSPWSV